MKKCPVCNEISGDNAEKCFKCKHEFSKVIYTCSKCHKVLQDATSSCECGGWAVNLKTAYQEEITMNWSREELKTNAKSRIYPIIWYTIIACLLISVFSKWSVSLERLTTFKIYELQLKNSWFHKTLIESMNYQYLRGIFIWIYVVSLLWVIFVQSPYIVGKNRFFMINIYGKTSLKSVLFGFDRKNYGSVVIKMLIMYMKIFLWSFLFIIPGIVKQYEYLMVPYILSENPKINKDTAFRISKMMMYQNKWDVFVLDLSFILWLLLDAITLGFAGVVWVYPYMQATKAELYHKYRTYYLRNGYVDIHDLVGYEEE